MAGKIEYFEKPSNPSVNKFNVSFFEKSFLKKNGKIFAGITIILYLWGVTRKYNND